MRQAPVDHETYQEVRRVWLAARSSATDPIEDLHYAGLLWSSRREREIQIATLERLAEQLGLWRPVELLRLAKRTEGASSPKDMLDAVNMFLEQYIDHWRKEPL